MLKSWLVTALTLLIDKIYSRKTINFGFYGPQARFVTIPEPNILTATSNDPSEVAKAFISSLSSRLDEYSYRLRNDSYTDPNTGVTHVYAKQMYNELDIVDADFNVNIFNGRVISYGNDVGLFLGCDESC